MSLFAVARIAGPGWAEGSGAFDQPGVNEHAAFMSHLADEGFVLYAGPLAGSETGRSWANAKTCAASCGSRSVDWPVARARSQPCTNTSRS